MSVLGGGTRKLRFIIYSKQSSSAVLGGCRVWCRSSLVVRGGSAWVMDECGVAWGRPEQRYGVAASFGVIQTSRLVVVPRGDLPIHADAIFSVDRAIP